MLARKILFLVIAVLFIIPSLPTAASASTPPAQQASAVADLSLGWTLTEGRVVGRGETITMGAGSLTTGYTVEARAVARGSQAPFAEGKFQLVLSLFSPPKDMPGQKAGRWYLQGVWTITDAQASKSVVELRHSPAVIKGAASADLDYNPIDTGRGLTAAVALPMSIVGDTWARSAGSLTLNDKAEGELLLEGKVWPSLMPANGPEDAPGGRMPPRGTVPNPGTQEQELANITFPAPYNVFEFVVTCAACHSGSVDQQAGHFGNWAGSAMASAARDPVFRANQQIVNQAVQDALGKDGGGNICIRCHSPNAWYSGRTDPQLAGQGDASNLIHSPLLSTDDEGILCEFCHRTIGGVTMKRADLDPADPVWNMMADIDDWPHTGTAYPEGPAAGNPYGDNTMQINDGMAYTAKYPGSSYMSFSDVPMTGTLYTGQTYAVYPPFFPDAYIPAPPAGQPRTNPAGERIVYGPDGSVPIHFEVPVGPPIDPGTGWPDYQAQAVSLEHPTFGQQRDANGEGSFVTTPEFCGTCHDLTVPVLNHGMPEQRTYTEWKASALGDEAAPTYKRCQDCHMPTMMHEYADGVPVSLNPDPLLAGWFPYGKDRNLSDPAGTAFHKWDGSNIDLPDMMSVLYPEVDLEIIGAPTGHDTRIFPGMLSNREPMWERTQRNNKVHLSDEAVAVEIISGPTWNAGLGKWEVQVQVTNKSGHRLPTGYPDGRRVWVGLQVKDANNAVVYQSGHYDQDSATLFTDATMAGFSRAVTSTIDSTQNAVMVYEKVTAACTGTPPTSCTPSVNLLNPVVMFDNRLPPLGYDYGEASVAGGKFVTYDPATNVPSEDPNRFGTGNIKNNFDVITYRFDAPETAVLNARAEVYWQTHTREFMEHLRENNTSTYRPEGPPSIYDPNYPLTPKYLSDSIQETTGVDFGTMTSLDGAPLNDNWGGIAYAAWLLTGKGAPFLAAVADTSVAAPPAAPLGLTIAGMVDPNTGLNDPFTQKITWEPVADAEGYYVWIRYGLSDATASWDRLALVRAPDTSITNTALNVAKTYGYKIQAFNAAGLGPETAVVTASTPIDLPLPPENLMVSGTTTNSIGLAWFDGADNDEGFIIERQDVPAVGPFYLVADVASVTPGFATGGNAWKDTGVLSGRCYNYRVAAYNASGPSTWNANGPVTGCTGGAPTGPITLTATAASAYQVDLAWSGAAGQIVGYRIQRSIDGGATWPTVFNMPDPNAVGYSDTTVQPDTTYTYRVQAYNNSGSSPWSNEAVVTTPPIPPTAPTGLVATPFSSTRIDLTWADTSNNEDGFVIQRGDGSGPRVVFADLATVAAGVTTYNDTTVQSKSTYSYRVRAFNAGGDSGYTNVAVAVTPGEIPQRPEGLRIVRIAYYDITIGWQDKSNNESGFYIERSTNGGATWTRVGTVGINVTTFKNVGLNRRTTYWYRVQAFNADGVSEYSETVSGTTR